MPEPPSPLLRRLVDGRWLAAIGRFWWAFLVGDTPDLVIGAAVALGVVAFVCSQPGSRREAAVLLPVLVIAVLGQSVWRAARRRTP